MSIAPRRFIQRMIAVEGMPTWRSFWNELGNVHHLRFDRADRKYASATP